MACSLDVDVIIRDVVQKEIKNITFIRDGFAQTTFEFGVKDINSIASLNKRFGEVVVNYTSPPDSDTPGNIKISISEKLYDVYIKEIDKKRAEKLAEENRAFIEKDAKRAGVDDIDNYLYQKDENKSTKNSLASEKTIKKIKEVAKKMGIDIQDLALYAKKVGLDTTGINGIADLTKNIIAIAEGKESQAITEEVVHIATAILEQTNPKLVTEMISKIDRFKIYKETYKAYKDNKNYQLSNDKPDIRKIKKEAVDRLIAEIIINNNENIEQYPELREEINQSLVRNWWIKILDHIRGMYRKVNIDIFQETANTILSGEIRNVKNLSGIFYQISDKQKSIQDKLTETKNSIKKVILTEKVDPLLLDSEEASNFYEVQDAEGNWSKVKKRVTDRVKAWYKKKFGVKVFTSEEKVFNELKRNYGVQGHADFEEIHSRYYDEFGVKRDTVLNKPSKFNLSSQDIYDKLENYYVDLVNSFPEGTVILSEQIIYDKKEKEAGTIDFLAIEPSGKTHILDWKFMSVTGEDVPWYKQGAFNIQLGTYKKMLRDNYSVKEFGMTRAIPIIMEFKKESQKVNSPIVIKGIAIGSVDVNKIENLKLVPVSEQTESTGYEALDEVIIKLNGLLNQMSKEKVTSEEDRGFKKERENTLKTAIRLAHSTLNILPIIDVIGTMRKEGDRILAEYNTIYKNRVAISTDSNNTDLSEFSDSMNKFVKISEEFVDIDRKLGFLIYNPQMLKDAKSEKEITDVNNRKDILNQLQREADGIYESREAIKKATLKFADVHIGQRNLVTGLLNAEKVLSGIGSVFRGVNELSLKSLEILSKLTKAAQSKASAAALEEIKVLMNIRKKLADKGGDLKKLVQQVYQKDSENKIVNKLIHKYNGEFHKTVDKKAAEGGDIDWLQNNIDLVGYKLEANKIIERQIKYINNSSFLGTELEENDRKEFEILKIKKQWDVTRKDFNGWDNYVIKRHPLEKWYSEEYKNILKNADLLELYDFIVKFNEKSKEVGYISNSLVKNFLPFVQKSMAEQLVWDNRITPVDNFYKNLQINPDTVGYGSINEVTGELENSIPKYYTLDFSKKEDGTNDYSQISEDLFKNMIVYIQQVEKYKYMTEIEGQLKLVKSIEEYKGHLNTDRTSKVVLVDGKPQELPGNAENAKMFDDFLRVLLYEQKYVLSDSDTPLHIGKVLNFVKKSINNVVGKEVWKENEGNTATSLHKSIDTANRFFQLKTLGLDFISGAVNFFGGNIQISTQAGDYFKAREFAVNEIKLVKQKFNSKEERDIFTELVNTFMPLKDDPSYEMYKEAGMSKLTQGNLGDLLFVFMRKPEILLEKTVFLTLLQNTMIVDGKIVSIKKFVNKKYGDRFKSSTSYYKNKDIINAEIEELKKTKAISVTRKLENGKLVIPGLDLTNREELQRLTNLSRNISSGATGNISKENINRASMSIWTKSMMVFKNWIPKLADTRFSEFRKVSDDFSVRINEDGIAEGQKYDIGRIRLLGHILTFNIFQGAINLKNILYLNDKGLAQLDELFEEYRTKYENENGETLNMSKEDFIDLIRTNLRNQVKELLILGSLFGIMLSMGFLEPEDDEDKATKNFHRYALKVVDKFVGELSFFYNPAEIEHILSGGIFPAIGIVNDFSRFTSHFFKQVTGMDFDSKTTYDEARKKALPIKYAMKMLPVTKSLVTYFGIFSNDFANEFDVTIQKNNK